EKAYHLAKLLDDMLGDAGKKDSPVDHPDLTIFWALADRDSDVEKLKKNVLALRERVLYSDPVILTSQFGQGRVVALMTTAGKEWNNWGGGEGVSKIYPSILWELQNYLSRGGGGDAGRLVGSPRELAVEAKRYEGPGQRGVKVVRWFHKAKKGEKVMILKEGEQLGVERDGLQVFAFDRSLQPG